MEQTKDPHSLDCGTCQHFLDQDCETYYDCDCVYECQALGGCWEPRKENEHGTKE